MIRLRDCTRVLVEGVTLTNSPNVHLITDDCEDVTIEGVTIKSPADSPNTDGLNPSGWNYHIARCTIDTGDDNIAIKAHPSRRPDRPSCENMLIEHCTFLHGHGMSVGGQTPGGLRGLVVRDCSFDGTEAGIRLKAPRGDGGLVEDCAYEKLTMKHVKVPIYITSYYPSVPKDVEDDPAQPVTPPHAGLAGRPHHRPDRHRLPRGRPHLRPARNAGRRPDRSPTSASPRTAACTSSTSRASASSAAPSSPARGRR